MKIESITKLYYPTKEEMDVEALERFCRQYSMGPRWGDAYRTICRGGIGSIEDLYNADIKELERMRGMGSLKLEYVMYWKNIINHLLLQENL